jgi:hypothetical protein
MVPRENHAMYATPYILRMYWNRFLYRLTGRKPRLGALGCAYFTGRELDGGYYFLTSPDLPGFRATLAPDQINDIATLTTTIQPALEAYLHAYMRAQRAHDQRISAQFSKATLPRHGRSMNLVAELCLP